MTVLSQATTTNRTKALSTLNPQSALTQLKALGYSDGDMIYYRAIKKLPNSRGKVCKLPDRYPNLHPELEKFNQDDYSIYFVINGGGDCDDDVREGKAVFYEHDDLEKAIQLRLWQSLNLPEPTFQVDTGGKSIHSYWVFEEPIDRNLWETLQTDLVNYSDADKKNKNLSRVMRLAGCPHPSTGIHSEIVSHSGKNYTFDDIRSAVPPSPVKSSKSQPKTQPKSTQTDVKTDVNTDYTIPNERLLTRAHRAMLSGTKYPGRSNAAIEVFYDLVGVAALGSIECDYRGKDYRLTIADNAEDLYRSYCDGCNPPLSEEEGAQIWASAQKSDNMPSIQDEEALRNCARSYLSENVPKLGRPSKPQPQRDDDCDYQDIAKKLGIDLSDKDIDKRGVPFSKLLKLKLDLFNLLGDRLKFNEMSREIELDKQTIDLDLAKDFVSTALKYDSSTENCIIALNAIATKFKYHPVREYLESLRGKTVDLDLVANFPKRYFGNSDPLQNRLFFRKLVASIARVMKPGTKDDSLLVLQGKQGALKSTALSVLAGDNWFNADLGSLENKDEIAKLSRFWILELAEVDYLFGKKEVEVFKRFLSCAEDTFRPPYGRKNITAKRSCALFATTNKTEFLTDPTGDRRYWVVEVKETIDIEGIRRDRDTIWATALAAYESGHIHYLDPIEHAQHVNANAQWRDDDPWEDTILPNLDELLRKIGSIEYVDIQEIMDRVLEIPKLHQGKSQRNRIGATLQGLGFERMTRKIGGKAKKIWGRELFTAKSNPTIEMQPNLKDGLPLETLMEQQENLSNLSNLTLKTLNFNEIMLVAIDTQVEKGDHLLIKYSPMAKDGFFDIDGLQPPSNPDSVSDIKSNLTQKDGLHKKDGLHLVISNEVEAGISAGSLVTASPQFTIDEIEEAVEILEMALDHPDDYLQVARATCSRELLQAAQLLPEASRAELMKLVLMNDQAAG